MSKQSKKVKRYYAVMGIYKKGEIHLTETGGTPFVRDSTFSDNEAGIIGVIPVFTDKKKAERFAGKHEIATLEVME